MLLKKYSLALLTIITITSTTQADWGSIDIDDIKDIDSSIGEINTDINNFLKKYDLESIIKNIGLESQILGCLTDGQNIGSILGQAIKVDGICGSMSSTDLGLYGIFENPVIKCAGVAKPQSITDAKEALSSLCGMASGINNSNNGIWDSTTGENGNNGDTGIVYSPIATIATGIQNSAVTGGVDIEGSSTKLKDKAYPNGLTVGEILGEGGGKILKNANRNPQGSDASAIKKNKTATLILKEMASKLNKNGSTDASKIGLPATKLDVIKNENASAELIGLGVVDFFGLSNFLIDSARKEFKSITANSLDEYYSKEKKAFIAMIKQNKAVSAKILSVRNNAMIGITNEYTIRLDALKGNKDYIFNTSQAYANLVKKEHRDDYILNSMVQNNKETELKGEMSKRKREINQKIDNVIADAYYLASIFRADIAKNEIDTILKAVDTAIK